MAHRKWHGISQDTVTDAHYDIIYTPNVNPYTVEFRGKHASEAGRVYLVPVQNIISMEVADAGKLTHQPAGTHPAYDTPTGRRKDYSNKKGLQD